MIHATFEAYMATRSTTYTHEVVSMRETWHARDAEIADLQRQLRERDHNDLTEEIEVLFEQIAFEKDEKLTLDAQRLKKAMKAALDAYVEERVDRAVLAESEAWNRPLDRQDAVNHSAHDQFLSWCEECRDQRLAANRAKVGTGDYEKEFRKKYIGDWPDGGAKVRKGKS